MRARAAELYTSGRDAHEVAAALGITERQARRYKSDVSADVKAAASATIEGVVEGGNIARNVIVKSAADLAGVLVDAATGQLKHGDDQRADPIERDPQMINARTKAASAALQFICAVKVEANHGGAVMDALAAALLNAKKSIE